MKNVKCTLLRDKNPCRFRARWRPVVFLLVDDDDTETNAVSLDKPTCGWHCNRATLDDVLNEDEWDDIAEEVLLAGGRRISKESSHVQFLRLDDKIDPIGEKYNDDDEKKSRIVVARPSPTC